jgi:choline monooxygenase
MNEYTISESDLRSEPLERASTIPSAWYRERSVFDLEQQAVFSRTWQYAGFVARLAEVGSQFCTEIAGEPVLLVRGKDSKLRAFYNVCRHRGGPIVMEDGCSSMLQCKYHGWTYTLDGMLRGVPDFDRVELFDKRDFGLVPIELEEWNGHLFVRLSNSGEPLLSTLAGIAERTRNAELKTLTHYKRDAYDIQCNWKVYVDNYLEGYHVPIVHPELFRIYDFNRYVTETRGLWSLQSSPLGAEEALYSKRVREGVAREALYYFIYPNLMLNILPGRLQTNLVVPLSPDRCRVLFEYYYEDIESAESLRLIEEDISFSHRVQLEDVEICEWVQRGLSSRSYDRGRFSAKRENAVHHFQNLLKHSFRTYADSPVAEGIVAPPSGV